MPTTPWRSLLGLLYVCGYWMHPAVRRMAHALWNRGGGRQRAADVLAAAGVGPRQAHRLFAAWFGATPKQAILAQQLALAEGLLREGSGVAAAAAACGFPDRRALTRAWRRARGAAPTAALTPPGGRRGRDSTSAAPTARPSR